MLPPGKHAYRSIGPHWHGDRGAVRAVNGLLIAYGKDAAHRGHAGHAVSSMALAM